MNQSDFREMPQSMPISSGAGRPPPALSTVRVLHVTYRFESAKGGGTEVYVAALTRELEKLGIDSYIAVPALVAGWRKATVDGVAVLQFGVSDKPSLELAYGAPDSVALENFTALLRSVRPHVVHFHAKSAAVSWRTAEIAKRFGCKVVFTFHTPTATCVRGTRLLYGRETCDGRLSVGRCSACVLNRNGVPRSVAPVVAQIGRALSALGLSRLNVDLKIVRALRVPQLVAGFHEATYRFLRSMDRIVAVCKWVDETLETVGIPKRVRSVSRQGLAHGDLAPANTSSARWGETIGEPIRLAFFGRLAHEKGLHLVVAAMEKLARADLMLDVFGISERLTTPNGNLEDAVPANVGSKIRYLPSVDASDVPKVMARYHAIVVPSLCLETGPLVVLEAQAAQTPVIGTARGGICELVQDQVDGILIRAPSVDSWSRVLSSLSREQLRLLSQEQASTRRMRDVAEDMRSIYTELKTQ